MGGVIGLVSVLGVGALSAYAGVTALTIRDATSSSPWIVLVYVLAGVVVIWAYLLLAADAWAKESVSVLSTQTQTRTRSAAASRRAALLKLWQLARQATAGRQALTTIVLTLALLAAIAGLIALGMKASELVGRSNSIFYKALPPGGSVAIRNDSGDTTLGDFLGEAPKTSTRRFSTLGSLDGVIINAQQRWDMPELRDPELRALNGRVLTLEVRTIGLEGEALSIRWTMNDGESDLPIGEPFFADQPAFPTPIILPRDDPGLNSVKVWVPAPPQPGEYSITVSVEQGYDVIASETTDIFANSRSRQL
jgi:hypothetical protein